MRDAVGLDKPESSLILFFVSMPCSSSRESPVRSLTPPSQAGVPRTTVMLSSGEGSWSATLSVKYPNSKETFEILPDPAAAYVASGDARFVRPSSMPDPRHRAPICYDFETLRLETIADG